jgi:hypothetical protein
MRDRCNNPRCKNFRDYGGRGIKMLFSSFEEFLAEVGLRPTPKHWIERICNDGHYESGNVKWATKIEQANNTRANHFITFKGETKTVAQWATQLGINVGTIHARIHAGRWSPDRALSTPTLIYWSRQKRSWNANR